LPKIGVIGGSGFTAFDGFDNPQPVQCATPYGSPSSDLIFGSVDGQEAVFIARHGRDHDILPHRINYRANLWALKQAGVDTVVALATVGGIGAEFGPGIIVIPDQILDYTHAREHTFSPLNGKLFHIDFTRPYCDHLRARLIECADAADIAVAPAGTYAATQGPRFESAAEIDRLDRDGADVVGMTGMPETSLAREAGLCYATIALVVNRAAGRSGDRISVQEIKQTQGSAAVDVRRILLAAIPALRDFECRVPPAITP